MSPVKSDLQRAHRRLRYTGRFPPLRELRFANWELALDEEGRRRQDETTLRPALEQSHVSRETAWTVAEMRLAGGDRHLPAWVQTRLPRAKGKRPWRLLVKLA